MTREPEDKMQPDTYGGVADFNGVVQPASGVKLTPARRREAEAQPVAWLIYDKQNEEWWTTAVKELANDYIASGDQVRPLFASPRPAVSEAMVVGEAVAPTVTIPLASLKWWRELVDINPQDLAPRLDAYLKAALSEQSK